MLWIRRKSTLKRCESCPSIQPATTSETTDTTKWHARIPAKWLSGPGQMARSVLLKSVPTRVLVKKNEDGTVDLYSSVRLSARFVRRLFASLPLRYLNFSDIALVLLHGSVSVVIALSPRAVSDALRLDHFPEFCSSHVIPFLASVQEYISENKADLIILGKELLPAAKLLGTQFFIIMKLLSCKTLPFFLFCYSEIKCKLLSNLSEDEVKTLLLDALHVLKTCHCFVMNIGMSFPMDLLTFIGDNRSAIIYSMLKFIKTIARTLVVATPLLLRFACQLTVISCTTLEDAVHLVNSFLEENPEISDQLKHAFAEICSMYHESGLSLTDSISLCCVTVFNGLIFAWKLIRDATPVLVSFLDTHKFAIQEVFDLVVDVLLPMMCSVLRKLISSDTKKFIVYSIPLMIDFASTSLTLAKPFIVYGAHNIISSTSFTCRHLSVASYYSFRLSNSAASGIFRGYCEVLPDVIAACLINVPLFKSGITVVLSDMWVAGKIVVPEFYSATRTVSKGLKNCYLVVYPDVVKAVVFVYPDCVRAYRAVVPVLLEASLEAFTTMCQASYVVIPAAVNSVRVVAPAVWTATKVSSPIILSASFTVGAATKLALEELLRTSNSAVLEVLFASANGMNVVVNDLIHSYAAVSESSNHIFRKSLKSGVSVTSTAVEEVGSLLWMILCLKSVDIEMLSQSHFQFELNLRNGYEVTSSLCRKTNDLLSLSLKAMLLGKFCLKKSNRFAAASLYEANIRISQCYEKMEPVVVNLAVKWKTYLNAVLKFDSVQEEHVEERETFQAACSWYTSHRVFGSVSMDSSIIENSLPLAVSEFSRGFVLMLFKAGSTVWQSLLFASPTLWNSIKVISPVIWHQFCHVAPIMWTVLCKISQKAWNYVEVASPELWQTYRTICVAFWKVLCKVTPKIWQKLKDLSPIVWSFMCKLSAKAWAACCDNSSTSMDFVCKYGPLLWEHFSRTTVSSWTTYCRLISMSWHGFCFGVETSWKIQRMLVSTWWQVFMANKSTLNSSSKWCTFSQAMLKLGGNAWFCFCAATALCVIIYQSESLKDLLMDANFNGTDLSAHPVLVSSESESCEDTVHLPKANQALQYIVKDIILVRSFFDRSRSLVRSYLNTSSLKYAINLRSKLSVSYNTAAEKVFSNRYIQGYWSC